MRFSSELQAGVYSCLREDNSVKTLIGQSIFDAPPDGALDHMTNEFITLGEETVKPLNTKTSRGSVHDFVVVVHSDRDGFEAVKNVAGAVCECLVGADIHLSSGTLVDLRFLRARASRGMAPAKRRIDLRFRATVDGQ